MGLARSALKVLMKERARRPFSGAVLTLGRQNIYFTYGHLQKAAEEQSVPLRYPLPSGKRPATVADDYFFSTIGFDRYESLDFSAFEGAGITFDLNNTELPDELVGAFDVVIDSGTIEHVFHLPNVLKNIYSLLTPGGRIIHIAPSSNHIDHGFYMFSPALFWDFYTANNFELNTVQIFRYSPRNENARWRVSNYVPGCLNKVGAGGLDDAMYGVICIATKEPLSTGNVIPQQGSYASAWQRAGAHTFAPGELSTAMPMATSTGAFNVLNFARRGLRRHPALFALLRRMYRNARSLRVFKGLHLKSERY